MYIFSRTVLQVSKGDSSGLLVCISTPVYSSRVKLLLLAVASRLRPIQSAEGLWQLLARSLSSNSAAGQAFKKRSFSVKQPSLSGLACYNVSCCRVDIFKNLEVLEVIFSLSAQVLSLVS